MANAVVNTHSIAAKVASYTDLIIGESTVTNNEYYMDFTSNTLDDPNSISGVKSGGSLAGFIDRWLDESFVDIFRKVETLSPSNLHEFNIPLVLNESPFKLSGGSYDGAYVYLETDEAKKYAALRGDLNKFYEYSDSNSIHKASLTTPIHIIKGDELHYFPNTNHKAEIEYRNVPTQGIVYYIPADVTESLPGDPGSAYYGATACYVNYPLAACHDFYTHANVNTATDMVNSSQLWPAHYLPASVYFVASRLLQKRMMDMVAKLPKQDDYSTSIDEEDIDSEGWIKVRYYIEDDEDTELASAKMSELNGQQQEWVLKYQWYQQQKQLVDSYYINIFMTEKGGQ